MNNRSNKQETKEKSCFLKNEAVKITDSALSSCVPGSNEEHVVKVDHGLNSSSSTENIKIRGGAVIIDYLL